jgi:hypothetical protein
MLPTKYDWLLVSANNRYNIGMDNATRPMSRKRIRRLKNKPGKPGRNDPCFCGSGRKFKKCCLPHERTADFRPVTEGQFSPKELAEIEQLGVQVELERQERLAALRQIGIFIELINTISHNGRKYYYHAGGIASINKENATFHEILIYNLQQVLGVEWWNDQVSKSWDEMHHIARCFKHVSDTVKDESLWEPVAGAEGVSSKVSDGYGKYLLNLAFDVYILSHTKNTPPPDWIERLKSYDQFEGKRYEISVASIFARAGCKIEYLSDERGQAKHPEFRATFPDTDETICVEAKARTKAGALHTKGEFDLKKATKLKIVPLINDALRKETNDQPYFIFVDANFPENLIPPTPGKHWIERVIENLAEQMGRPTPEKPFKYNFLAVTNYSYHYDKEGDSTHRNSVCSVPLYSVASLTGENMAEKIPGMLALRIMDAVNGYGIVPNL